MPKIAECERCLLYAATPYVVCTVHPQGVSTEHCLDFRPDPNKELPEQWSPEGYSFYDGNLVRNQSRLSREEQLAMLDTHPFFTGVYPSCGHRFDSSKPPVVHWDCPSPDCDWMDDSV